MTVKKDVELDTEEAIEQFGPETEKEFTHYIVAVPREGGRYRDPEGNRVNLHKFKKHKDVHTDHPIFKGSTITDFVKQSDFTKA